MKDAVYNIKILIALAAMCIAFMVFGAFEESWSQNHTNDYDFLLYGALGAIVTVFTIRSFTHPLKDKKLFDAFNMTVRNKHMNRVVAYLFFGVLVFGVNSNIHWVENLHLIFTGLAIAAVYANLFYYYRTGIDRVAAVVAIVIGCGMFLWSYFGSALTIAEGEAFAAIPIIIWVLRTTKMD